MDINATLLGQMLVFGILIWFSWKFIWPPLVKAVEDRQKKIADGLAAAERGQKELHQASGEAAGIVNEAREKALKIVDQANRRSNEIIRSEEHTSELQSLITISYAVFCLEKKKTGDGFLPKIILQVG